jgi:hypothetical protein
VIDALRVHPTRSALQKRSGLRLGGANFRRRLSGQSELEALEEQLQYQPCRRAHPARPRNAQQPLGSQRSCVSSAGAFRANVRAVGWGSSALETPQMRSKRNATVQVRWHRHTCSYSRAILPAPTPRSRQQRLPLPHRLARLPSSWRALLLHKQRIIKAYLTISTLANTILLQRHAGRQDF